MSKDQASKTSFASEYRSFIEEVLALGKLKQDHHGRDSSDGFRSYAGESRLKLEGIEEASVRHKTNGGSSCHAGIREKFPLLSNKKPEYLFAYTYAPSQTDKELFQWITGRDSMWSSLFSNRFPWTDQLNDGVYILDFPAESIRYETKSFLYNFLVATRTTTEYNWFSPVWSSLVKSGVSPRLAFFVSYLFRESGEDFVFLGNHTGTHQCFSYWYNTTGEYKYPDIRRILTGSYESDDEVNHTRGWVGKVGKVKPMSELLEDLFIDKKVGSFGATSICIPKDKLITRLIEIQTQISSLEKEYS